MWLISFLPYIDRNLKPQRGYAQGSEEHLFETEAEARALWRRIRQERRGERIQLYTHDVRYPFQRRLVAEWHE